MVIHTPQYRPGNRSGWLMIDLLVAMAFITVALLPIAYSLSSEKRLARAVYQRAVAVALVDGEAEVLAAGAWRDFTNGVHEYSVRALAATNLPPGHFVLRVAPDKFRLEWQPQVRGHGGPVVREVKTR
jgi:hypothetical protein